MDTLTRLLSATALSFVCASAAHAESLRCNGESSSPGDSKLSVLRKCGEPMFKDTYCKPVEVVVPTVPYPVVPYPNTPYPVVVPGRAAACEQVDAWLYDRGAGNLYATVRFQRGVVESIVYEGRPR
ncbi:MAG: DUF2845 domain-containing protein [Rhizobacter sp.]|jgi:hypothetical protein